MAYTENDISVIICKRLGIDIGTARNGNVMARCIFHEDKTPSLSINLDKGIFHGFCCGKSGILKNLYYEKEGRSILRDLQIRRDEILNSAYSFSTAKDDIDLDRLPDYDFYFEGNLLPIDSTEKGRSFLKERGVSKEDALRIGMKFCSQGNTKSKSDPSNTKEWINFKDRAIIPIYEAGQLLSLEGRDTRPKEEIDSIKKENPNYVYKKVLFPRKSTTNTLFQWEQLDTTKTIYIVEGLMDLMCLRTSSFFSNSSCYFGASISSRQIFLLDKFPSIVIIPDNDHAGVITLKKLMKSYVADKVSILPPPPNCKDVNDMILGKNPNFTTIEEARSKQWGTRMISLNETSVKLIEERLNAKR